MVLSLYDYMFLEEGSHSYSCVYAQIPDEYSRQILYWSLQNIHVADLETELEKGLEDNIHVTIKYGLHTERLDDVDFLIKNQKSFPIFLQKVSVFENEKANVLKVDIDSPVLHVLFERLKNFTSNIEKFNEYKPHMTLAYLKKSVDYSKYLVPIESILPRRFITINTLVFNTKSDDEYLIELRD